MMRLSLHADFTWKRKYLTSQVRLLSTPSHFTKSLHHLCTQITEQSYTLLNNNHKQETAMKPTSKTISIILLALMFLLSACKANISRNQDGSFDVETTISQQELQEAITASIADPLVKEITVSLQSGYMLVSGTRERLNDASKTDSLSFRVDL